MSNSVIFTRDYSNKKHLQFFFSIKTFHVYLVVISKAHWNLVILQKSIHIIGQFSTIFLLSLHTQKKENINLKKMNKNDLILFE